MSPAEWIITIVVITALVVLVVARTKAQQPGQRVPGRMCAGCPNACSVREKPPACMEKAKPTQK